MNGESVCAVVLDYHGAEKTEKCLMSLSGQSIQTACVPDNLGSYHASPKLHDAFDRLDILDPSIYS